MRRLWILGWLLAAALAQGLVLPEAAQAERPVEISAEGLEPGAYPIEIEGPAGAQVVTLVTTENGGVLSWTPPRAGRYRFTLYAPRAKYTAELEVAPPPPRVALEPEGLRVGERLLPLPAGDWLAPLEESGAVYLALRGAPLVLRLSYDAPLEPAAHYPPAPVEALASGPLAKLADGRTLALDALGPESGPYVGPMEALAPLHALDAFWRDRGVLDRLPADPGGYRPYWVYWVLPAERLTPADLAAWGRDLLRRGHRVELAWGEEARAWTDAWQRAARAGRTESLEPARSLALALLTYAPLHPGAQPFFREQAAWLEAQGRWADAEHVYASLQQLRSFEPPWIAEELLRVGFTLLLAYLALIVVLFVRYLPAQRRGLAPLGGLLASWSRNPLRRMAHLLLVYAGWGERLLATLLFAALIVTALGWSWTRSYEQLAAELPLGRATLAGAESGLAGWPDAEGRALIEAAAFVDRDPQAARAHLPERPFPLAFAEALKFRLGGDVTALRAAYRLDAGYTPVLERLGLGADAWSAAYREAGVDRLGSPRMRDLALLYLAGAAVRTWSAPTGPLQVLGLDPVWSWIVFVVAAGWLLLHLWVLILPRPRGAVRAAGPVARAVELLVPGSNSLGKGWGVVLLLAAAYGAVRWALGDPTAGALWLAAAYLPHLVLWYGEVHR